jgi:SET family sugar efflux transporter-like MFS transporter
MSTSSNLRLYLLRPALFGLLFTTFALGLAYAFVIPFSSLWGIQVIGMTPAEYGAFMVVTSTSAIVLSTALARLSDTRLTRRTLLLLAGVGGLLGYVGYAFVRSGIALAAIGSLALGVASVGFSQLFAHAREELARPEHEGRDPALAMSVLRACFALSWTVGPALSAIIMRHLGYRGVFLTAAGLFACFLLGVWCAVPARPHPRRREASVGEPVLRVLMRRANLSCFLSFVLMFGAFALCTINLPLLITKRLGGNEDHVGVSFGLAALSEIPLMVWFGSLVSRGHQTRVIRGGLLAGIGYFVVLTWAGVATDVYPAQLLNAACVAVTASVAIPYFQDLTPGQTGLGTTMYSSAYSAGNLLGYVGFGALFGWVGERGVLWACAAMAATSFIVFLTIRPNQDAPQGEARVLTAASER